MNDKLTITPQADAVRPLAVELEDQQAMAGHTPEPWHIAEYGEPRQWISIKRGACLIAKIEAATWLNTQANQAIAEANARLIASAPRLLRERDALMMAMRQFEACNLNDNNCASLEIASRRIRNIARNALSLCKSSQ